MYSVGLYTLGCKVSQYETEAIAEAFERKGCRILPFGDVCDIYVINTCTVTRESDRKSRQIIRRAIGTNPHGVICVVGCYSQRAPESVASIDGVDICLGTNDKLTVVEHAMRLADKKKEDREHLVSAPPLDNVLFEPMCITRGQRTRVYVKIEDGCESKCTYCAISSARGPVRSKPMEQVISEVEGLAANGTKEIVLTGIETGSYGKDLGLDNGLGTLIRTLWERGSCERIRLGSLAPELVGEKFAESIKGVKTLAPHFHISMQSGSDSVLKNMKRRYNTRMAYENIERLRDTVEGAQFTTDMMVGFPNESEEDFLATVEFVKKARFLDVHVFAYSRREGTPAAEYDGQIPEDVKRRRSAYLIDVKNRQRDEILAETVKAGKPLRAILESYRNGRYTAHSDSFIELSVEADRGMNGEYVWVEPLASENGVISCKIIK